MEPPYWCTSVGTPIWRPGNSINIWNLLWLSRPLIICTEQANIYMNTLFPYSLASQMAKNHEMNIYFLANVIVALYHGPP